MLPSSPNTPTKCTNMSTELHHLDTGVAVYCLPAPPKPHAMSQQAARSADTDCTTRRRGRVLLAAPPEPRTMNQRASRLRRCPSSCFFACPAGVVPATDEERIEDHDDGGLGSTARATAVLHVEEDHGKASFTNGRWRPPPTSALQAVDESTGRCSRGDLTGIPQGSWWEKPTPQRFAAARAAGSRCGDPVAARSEARVAGSKAGAVRGAMLAAR